MDVATNGKHLDGTLFTKKKKKNTDKDINSVLSHMI